MIWATYSPRQLADVKFVNARFSQEGVRRKRQKADCFLMQFTHIALSQQISQKEVILSQITASTLNQHLN
jgi:hypothetical protein